MPYRGLLGTSPSESEEMEPSTGCDAGVALREASPSFWRLAGGMRASTRWSFSCSCSSSASKGLEESSDRGDRGDPNGESAAILKDFLR